MPRKRFFRPGELPLVVLTLLEAKPANGYQLLVRLHELFSPDYEPSTGSLYPALAALEAEGLIDSEMAGRTKTFFVSEDGLAMLHARPDAVADIETRTQRQLRRSDSLDGAVARFISTVMSMGLTAEEVAPVLDRTVRTLKRTRRRKSGS